MCVSPVSDGYINLLIKLKATRNVKSRHVSCSPDLYGDVVQPLNKSIKRHNIAL